MRINRRTIKSPLDLARTALVGAESVLPPYSSKFSRHDFTQPQLVALLRLREFLGVDYRGLEVMVREWSDLRQALRLTKVPDHTTLQRAARRIVVGPLTPTPPIEDRPVQAFLPIESVGVSPDVVADAPLTLESA